MKKSKNREYRDDDMISFAEWYRMWYGHPQVGTNGYQALKQWKILKKEEKIKKEMNKYNV